MMGWQRRLIALVLLLVISRDVRSELVCEYQASVERATTGEPYQVREGVSVTFNSLNVGFGASGVSSIDISSPVCIAGSCPLLLRGFELDKLLPSLQAGSSYQDVLCYFGPDLPCTSVPNNFRPEELSCGSPTLPAEYGILPFGVLVLGPRGIQPGVLYLVDGLEVNFFDSLAAPVLHQLDPPASDLVELPDPIVVRGANLGPGRTGVQQPIRCRWGAEVSQVGSYSEEVQVAGDALSEIECPPPRDSYAQGDYVTLQVTLAGFDATEDLYSASAPVASINTLVFFNARCPRGGRNPMSTDPPPPHLACPLVYLPSLPSRRRTKCYRRYLAGASSSCLDMARAPRCTATLQEALGWSSRGATSPRSATACSASSRHPSARSPMAPPT